MPPWLVRSVLLPAHERLRGRATLQELRRLRRDERCEETLQRLRAEKIRALLAHCHSRVPYYRERLAGQHTPELADFPVLERDAVRAQAERLCAEGFAGDWLPSSTGGSSGEPLTFWTDRVKETRHNAHKLRFRQWFGVRPGDRQVDFWGSPIELGKSSRLRRFKDRVLLNQALCSAHDLTPERLDGYCQFLAHYRPHLIYGYPTVIARVAQQAAADPQRLRGWRPRVVVCTSEMLYPQLREAIRAGFGAPVVNEYGSRDGGLTAHECPQGRLHIAAEHVWVEVADADADGVGDLLVTNLDGWGMPFVRYRVGDRGRLSTERCPCGSPLPVLDRLEGRRNDFLVGGEGRHVHGSAANYVMREIPQVLQYRLLQREDRSLDVQVVAAEGWGAEQERAVTEGLRRVLGEPVPVRLQLVTTIAPSASGKYRWVESEAMAS